MASSRRTGTQSIERTIRVLKILASRTKFGWGLSDLAGRCGLEKPTTHRILSCLVHEGLASQRREDGRYMLGPLIFELSLTMRPLLLFVESTKVTLARLAKRFGAVCTLSLRSGSDCVHAARAGTVSIKGVSIDVGGRRPMISVSGGVAILAALPHEEAKDIVAANLRQLTALGYAVRSPEEMLRHARRTGYGFNRSNFLRGVHGLGVAVRGSGGQPFAALSLTGPASFFKPLRVRDVVAALRIEVSLIERDAELISSISTYYERPRMEMPTFGK